MKKLIVLALALAVAASCVSARKTIQPGTAGDGNPDKPNVSVGRLDFYPAFESKSGLVTPRNVYVWLP